MPNETCHFHAPRRCGSVHVGEIIVGPTTPEPVLKDRVGLKPSRMRWEDPELTAESDLALTSHAKTTAHWISPAPPGGNLKNTITFTF